MNSIAKSGVVSAVAWSVMRSWGTRVATMLVFFILTRILNPEEIGLISYILGWLFLLAVIADLGLAEYIVYNHNAARLTELGIWWFQVLVSLLITSVLIAFLLTGYINPDKTNAHAVLAMIVLAATLPISAAAKIPEALLRRQMDYKGLAIRSLVAISASSVIAIVLAIAGYGIWSLVFKQVTEVIIDGFYCFKLSKWRPSLHFEMAYLKKALQGGWGIVSSRILDVITQSADTLIIGSMFGMRDLGFYSMGKKIFQVLYDGVVQSVTGVIASAFGRVQNNPQLLKQLFLSSVKFSSLITVPLFMAAIALSTEWIPLVFGAKWVASAPVAQILLLTGLMAGYGTLNGFVLLANNRNKSFFTLMSANTIISLSLLAMLSQFGMLAAAAANPIKTLLILPISLWLSRRVINYTLSEYFSALKAAAVITLIITLAWVFVHNLFAIKALVNMSAINVAIGKAIIIGSVFLVSARLLYWQEIKVLRQDLRLHLS